MSLYLPVSVFLCQCVSWRVCVYVSQCFYVSQWFCVSVIICLCADLSISSIFLLSVSSDLFVWYARLFTFNNSSSRKNFGDFPGTYSFSYGIPYIICKHLQLMSSRKTFVPTECFQHCWLLSLCANICHGYLYLSVNASAFWSKSSMSRGADDVNCLFTPQLEPSYNITQFITEWILSNSARHVDPRFS